MEIKMFSRVQVVSNYPLISLKGESGTVIDIDGDTHTVRLDDGREHYFRKSEITLPAELIEAHATAQQDFNEFMQESPSFADLLDELTTIAGFRHEVKYPQLLEGLLQQEITRRAKAGQLD
ncbi:hypothetical protein SEA_LUCKYBARNES_55 [Brevibacterium phage LuckyBarnes]|uniref:Uncharacterized protein n=1 Tax=Brevibacterium phage LuckyBarnes TaxID=2027888 RepID=A0A249XNR4_9CAUD|nr:hypothetical protein HOS02_gp55 [Brevibacterium phage LuckyBarnes]ASZ73372.1 hypothetical protein SEA_LUCKYBARNES_55 [Brevibacterium phage LuckyBarnes]